jgi:hypothetical protein
MDHKEGQNAYFEPHLPRVASSSVRSIPKPAPIPIMIAIYLGSFKLRRSPGPLVDMITCTKEWSRKRASTPHLTTALVPPQPSLNDRQTGTRPGHLDVHISDAMIDHPMLTGRE